MYRYGRFISCKLAKTMTGPSMLSFSDQSGANVFNLAWPQAITSASKNRTEAKRCRIKKSNSWKSSFFPWSDPASSERGNEMIAKSDYDAFVLFPSFQMINWWKSFGDKNRTDQRASNLRPFDWKRWKAASEKWLVRNLPLELTLGWVVEWS